MSEETVSSARRRLLQGASVGGLALLLAGCSQPETGAVAGADEVDCDEPGEPGNPSDQDLSDLADELWAAFDQGVVIGSKSGAIGLAPGVRDSRGAHHTNKVKQNWSTLDRCRRLTRQCAFNTGVVAGVMAVAAGESEISEPMFILAAEAVFEMQKNRAGGGASFSGIAC